MERKMWKQADNSTMEGHMGKEYKQQTDSQLDSGFLSGSNLISSESSIDLKNEEETDEPAVAPEPVRAIDSGLDLGLTDNLTHLSLKSETINVLDSGIMNPESEELMFNETKSEDAQEPWEIYYTQDDDGDTQLHISIIQGFLEASFMLISMAPHPCLLNILNDDANTALHLAVLTHQPRIARRLMLAGADPTLRNFKGNTPLHLACTTGDLYCTKALTNPITAAERTWIEPGKSIPSLPQNLEQRNYNGEMCLHIAAAKGHFELVRHLCRLGADLQAREGLSGRTPLHLAIEHRQPEVVRVILQECRPQLDARTYAGLTAYHLACYVDPQLAKELVRLGATPSPPPGLFSDSEDDDEDEEDDEERDSAAYRATLARMGIGAAAAATAPTVATA